MYNTPPYETPEMPGASNHTNSATRDDLDALIEAQTTYYQAGAAMMQIQAGFARKAMTTAEALQLQLLTAKDNETRTAIGEQIERLYKAAARIVYDMGVPFNHTQQDHESDNVDQ